MLSGFEHMVLELLLREGAALGGRGYKSRCCVPRRTRGGRGYYWPTMSTNRLLCAFLLAVTGHLTYIFYFPLGIIYF